jgi:hypothetical protein
VVGVALEIVLGVFYAACWTIAFRELTTRADGELSAAAALPEA